MKLNDFTGYILAGGKSSRMGTDKVFLKIGNKTFIENAVEILKLVCKDRIKIVLNPKQDHFIEKLPPNIPHIFDIFENRGALGGIHSALKNCETKFAIILAVDLPFVTKEAIDRLANIAIESKEFSAIVPQQNDGRLQPLCAIYQVENCLPKLEEFLSKNVSSAVHNYVESIGAKIIDIKILSSKQNFLANINTPQDFE